MTSEQIQAIGNFLNYYDTDLNYIENFKDFKDGNILPSEYIQKNRGSFISFLIEYRVIRNVTQGKVDRLLEETYNWITGSCPDDVDGFAKRLSLTDLTRGSIMSSLASKILFLNNPWEIIPMDSLARKTLNQKANKYVLYQENLKQFKSTNKSEIEDCLNFSNSLINLINEKYKNKIINLDLISENRMMDKILWTKGK